VDDGFCAYWGGVCGVLDFGWILAGLRSDYDIFGHN
jgi:hypothetical protein